MVTKYQVDPDKIFQKALADAAKSVSDLTIPLTLIAKSWFKSNQFIFDVKGSSGKYADLSDNYKPEKLKRVGFIYPVLKAKGDLARSLTDPTDGDAISMILNKNSLVIGTKNKTAGFHQYGTRRMPARPPVLIGSEQTAPAPLNKRRDLWVETLANYVIQATQKGLGK